jgi:Arm DNA-binding domain/Phage integrase, N-terminal SAM-like domain
MQRLTNDVVEALESNGRDRIIFDSLLSGFALRVTPAGAKIFIAQAWVAGKKRRVTVGTFPEMNVADARKDVRPMLDDMRAGKNPALERGIRRKAITAGDMTVGALADKWMADYVNPKLKPRTADDYAKLFQQKIKPRFGHVPVSQITKDDVTRFHADLKDTPRRANYTLATLRALMTFAEDIGLRPPMSNPCRKLKMYREHARERFLSYPIASADGYSRGRTPESVAFIKKATRRDPPCAWAPPGDRLSRSRSRLPTVRQPTIPV